jgi:hypothetical protein
MNYIKKLEKLAAIRERALTTWDVEQRRLEGYLTSTKFHEDPTVQVRDVLNRLGEIRQAVGEALFEQIEVIAGRRI